MKTILFIEERPYVRENFIKLLTGPGDFFKVVTAGSVVEAVDLLGMVQVEIVIAGTKMTPKEMDLLDSRLRGHKQTKLVVLAERNSKLAKFVKAFEYKIQFELPVDVNLLLEMIMSEFGIESGGQLRGISISAFLQMIELEDKNCTIQVSSGGKKGALYCRNGDLIDAEIDALVGKEAAFEILGMENPLIVVDYQLEERESRIEVPLMSLLLESGRMKDETPEKKNEKRRYKRFNCSLKVSFAYDEWTHQGEIRNISLSGAYLSTKGPFSVGRPITISFFSQSLDKGCQIGGVIVRRDEEGLGIEFSAATINQMAILRTVIHEVAAS